MRGARILAAPGMIVLGWPRIAALAAAILTIMAFWSLSNLRFDNNVIRSIISDSEISRQFRVFAGQVEGTSSDIVLLAESDGGFDTGSLVALRDFALDIELMDGVAAVVSPFSARFPQGGEVYAGETVIPFDPEAGELGVRLGAYRDMPATTPLLLSEDLRTALIVVVADWDRRSPFETLAEIRDYAAGAEISESRLTTTGEVAISAEIVNRMTRDLLVLNSAGGLVGLIICGLVFRRIPAMITATTPALLGAAAGLSMFVATGYPVTVLSNVVGILVYVLALADCTHLTAYLTSLERGRPLRDRLRETVLAVGPACGLTAVTTSIAFAAIAISDNDPVREFAVVGALATLVSWVVAVVWFVLLALLLDPSIPGRKQGLPIPALPGKLKAMALDRSGLTVAVGIGIMVIAGFGFTQTKPWFSIYENLPETSDVRSAAETADDAFGGFFRVWAEYEIEAPGGWPSQAGWQELADKTDALVAALPDSPVVTPRAIAAYLGDPDAPPDPVEFEEQGGTLAATLLPPGGDTARAFVNTGDPMRDSDSLSQFDIVEAAVRSSGASVVTGLPVLIRHEPLHLVRQLSIGLVVACAICVALIAAAFGDLRLVPALLVPNLLPLAVTAASLHIFQSGQMSPSAMLALTVSFGIAVDDSIHFVNRYVHELRRGRDRRQALAVSMDETGKVLIATTLLICGGLLVTFFSAFSTVRLFGTMLILTFMTALAADLLLLPAFLRLRWFK